MNLTHIDDNNRPKMVDVSGKMRHIELQLQVERLL